MGRILGPFGVQGWIKVKAFTESPARLGEFAAWMVRTASGWREMRVDGFELHSKGPVARLAGCEGRGDTEALRGSEVAVSRQALGDAQAGALYWVDLIGLEVIDEDGTLLGQVEELFETGENSVMVVKGERERMIPFVPAYVKAVDLEAKRITVEWKADYDA